MYDIEDWVRAHDAPLEAIAGATGLPSHLVHVAAALVLAGASDDHIYDHLRAHVLSADGQHSPLAGAPRALAQIRQLAAI